jgi:peptide/nickel transport system ATP-binding protein
VSGAATDPTPAGAQAPTPGDPDGGGPLLEVQDLVATYAVHRGLAAAALRRPRQRVHAVDGVSISVAAGEVVALVGESGCGKTTLAQTIMGATEPERGAVRFEGREITHLPHRQLRPLRRRMQMVYQDPYESLDPRFTVSRTVAEPLAVHGVGAGRAERRQLVSEALSLCGLEPPVSFLDRYPHELSGGQRQRVAIAASIILRPRLLIADEPVSMLDVSVRAGVLSVLAGLRERGLGILMITHDLSVAAGFADRIYVMYLGRIVEQGAARSVVRNPQHPYTRALVSVTPRRTPSHGPPPQVLAGEIPDATRIPSGCRFHPRCPVAVDRCRQVDPELRPVPDAGGQQAACILL